MMDDPKPQPRLLEHVPVGTFAALLVFGLCGCLIIYSSRALGDTPFLHVRKQFIWLILGAVCFFGSARIPFEFWKKIRRPFILITVVLLAGLLLFGSKINGMRGWIRFGSIFNFQVSELAKIAFILCLSETAFQKNAILNSGLAAAVFCGLILPEPDMGTTSVFFFTYLILLWIITGSRLGVLTSLAAFVAASATFFLFHPYAVNRILSFWSPESESLRSAWHIRQFQYALANGGLFGSEEGAAVWANAYLPLPHTDSLFATITETSGCIGGLIVLFGFLILSATFIRMSLKDSLPNDAAAVIAGVGILYGIQALLHISVNVVLLPPTGITLPLLSYGGSSLLTTMLAFGLVFSASMAKRDESGVTGA